MQDKTRQEVLPMDSRVMDESFMGGTLHSLLFLSDGHDMTLSP